MADSIGNKLAGFLKRAKGLPVEDAVRNEENQRIGDKFVDVVSSSYVSSEVTVCYATRHAYISEAYDSLRSRWIDVEGEGLSLFTVPECQCTLETAKAHLPDFYKEAHGTRAVFRVATLMDEFELKPTVGNSGPIKPSSASASSTLQGGRGHTLISSVYGDTNDKGSSITDAILNSSFGMALASAFKYPKSATYGQRKGSTHDTLEDLAKPSANRFVFADISHDDTVLPLVKLSPKWPPLVLLKILLFPVIYNPKQQQIGNSNLFLSLLKCPLANSRLDDTTRNQDKSTVTDQKRTEHLRDGIKQVHAESLSDVTSHDFRNLKMKVPTQDERIEMAKKDFSERTAAAEAKREARANIDQSLVESLNKWSVNSDGSLRDVQILLSTIDSVCPSSISWTPVSIGDLIMNESSIKKTHRLAVLAFHPDRHQNAEADVLYSAERIFDAINEAFRARAV